VNIFPRNVYADFETAIHNAVTTVWQGCEAKTCCFHLGQSWWRKIQSLGLSKQYGKEDCEVNQFSKKIFGLSPLLPAKFSDCFALDLYPIFRTTSEWNSFATTCQKIILMQTPVLFRLFGPNVLHHR